ncbi:MAG: carboxypeptidase regulatory-like domain-containing protein [Clostridiaceae bacterium]|nr:carboxypeptidase regulatory-like domain-containing protein [Clostridiaceae bacterium]
MRILKEEYILGQSIAKNLAGIAESIRLDLSLGTNPGLKSGTFTGKVKDASGMPIPEATVILFNEDYSVHHNTLTGGDGIFIFPSLEPNLKYHAYAKAPGFMLSEGISFEIHENKTMETEFVLTSDSEEIKSIIVGTVKNIEGSPISTATVELYKNADKKPLYLTFVNEDGRFIICDLEPSLYFLKINAPGYFSEEFPVEITQPQAITIFEAVLKEDLKASKGIVTGIITDSENNPLANTDVILFRIGENGSQTPVAYTRSNNEGIYLFVNVPQGEYYVNSSRKITME